MKFSPQDIEEFELLLDKFQHLPETKSKPRTILEICGYPHFENVCSNILQFFFDPSEDHKLDEAVLYSLVSLVEPTIDPGELADVEVKREDRTRSGKLLDIVFKNEESLVGGIENKIRAPVYNDLRDYAEHLNGLAEKTGRPAIKIILCVKKPHLEEDFGFKMVTYEAFAGNILKNIGPKIPGANQLHLNLLLEFMATIENEKHGTHMNPSLLEFFKKNAATAHKFWHDAVPELISEMKDKSREVKNVFEESEWAAKVQPLKHWDDSGKSYRREFACGVSCRMEVAQHVSLEIEALITLSGWQINAYPVERPDLDVVEKFFRGDTRLSRRADSDWPLWEYCQPPYEADCNIVAMKFSELVEHVSERIRTNKTSVLK